MVDMNPNNLNKSRPHGTTHSNKSDFSIRKETNTFVIIKGDNGCRFYSIEQHSIPNTFLDNRVLSRKRFIIIVCFAVLSLFSFVSVYVLMIFSICVFFS